MTLLQRFVVGPRDSGESERPPMPDEGDVIGGHYRLGRRLGEGMFGRVFVAERTDVPEHRVALKLMTRAVYAGRNVERELSMLAAASHPHIVQLKDHGIDGDFVWLTMPLYEGETLAQRLERGPLSLREAYDIFLPIARGVQALHERGLRHQDIKPENIFLARFSERVHPVLLDLGVAVEKSSSFVAGTILYCSPEQVMALGGLAAAAELTEKIDTYCLATTLLEALGGAPAGSSDATTPLELANLFELREIAPLAERALPELGGEPRRLLVEAFRGWLLRDPRARADARTMAEQLDVLLEQEREAAAAIERALARQKVSLTRVRLALAAMAVVAAGAALYTFSKRETLRLAGELERARAEGKSSFDKLDTCVASHELERRRVERCDLDRREADREHHRALAGIAAGKESALQALEKKSDALRMKLRGCEDDAEKAAAAASDDKRALVAAWTAKSEAWSADRAKLAGERDELRSARDDARKERDQLRSERDDAARERDEQNKQKAACDAALGTATGARDECKAALGSCSAERDACRAPHPAPIDPAEPPHS